MENNKYYTPTIDEFHVGFEYEIKKESSWFVKHYNQGSLVDIYYNYNDDLDSIDFNENTIRVKYLDQKDIESLGFIYDEHYCEGSQFYKHINIGDSFTRFIVLDLFDNKITITKLMDYSKTSRINGIKLFQGKIKNKSELVKLLKQLGI
jgi:hypothetical protein